MFLMRSHIFSVADFLSNILQHYYYFTYFYADIFCNSKTKKITNKTQEHLPIWLALFHTLVFLLTRPHKTLFAYFLFFYCRRFLQPKKNDNENYSVFRSPFLKNEADITTTDDDDDISDAQDLHYTLFRTHSNAHLLRIIKIMLVSFSICFLFLFS